MIPFTKMHGLGNDYLVIESRHLNGGNLSELAVRMCTRRTGVGADGMLVISLDPLTMRAFNADGSEAEMCGNGIRCAAQYVYDRKLVGETDFDIVTKAGTMHPELLIENEEVKSVSVALGKPSFERRDIPMQGKEGRVVNEPLYIKGHSLNIIAMSLGVPHTVIFVDDLNAVDIVGIGSQVESHKAFINRTNVDFVQPIDHTRLRVKTYARGTGAQLSCGTGACAAVVAAQLMGICNEKATVELDVGELYVRTDKDGRVSMEGPCTYVFEGEW